MADTSNWIAIVDDDVSVLKALKRALRLRGLQSRTFESAQQFICSVPDGLPECLIVDLQMPEMTGSELHQYLTRSGIQIPTIIITAYGDSRVMERAQSAGIIAVLPKPLQKEALFAAIEAAGVRSVRD